MKKIKQGDFILLLLLLLIFLNSDIKDENKRIRTNEVDLLKKIINFYYYYYKNIMLNGKYFLRK